MRLNGRRKASTALCLAAAFIITSCASTDNSPAGAGSEGGGSASNYPAKPITLIVPFGAGGTTDTSARKIAKQAEEFLPQPIRVVNKTGGGGTIGYAQVAAAKPDGYTLGIDGEAPVLVRPKIDDLPYDKSDLRPVINLMTWQYAFAVQADAPWGSMQELLKKSKDNPKSIKVGVSGGIGQVPSINLALFSDETNVQWTMVPMPDGDPQGIAALLGGQVDAFIGTVGNIHQYVESGDFRVLMVFGYERHRFFPDAPVPSDIGYDMTPIPSYDFVFVPSETPDKIVQVLYDAFRKAAKQDDFKNWVRNNGYTFALMGPDKMQQRLDTDAKALAQAMQLLKDYQ